MISGYVSINTIVSKIYRDLDINSEVNFISIVEWAAEALAMIGAYSQYMETSTCLTMANGKARLPLGFEKLVSISYKNTPLTWATNTNKVNYQCSECQIPVCSNENQHTFYLNDSFAITNISKTDTDDGQEPNLCMVYLGVKVDEDGYPMIPDDIYYSQAVSSYIISKLDYQDWRKGKISDKVQAKSEHDWLFYVNSARGSANMPNAAQLENLKNIVSRLMPLRNEYKKGFKNISNPERLNLN